MSFETKEDQENLVKLGAVYNPRAHVLIIFRPYTSSPYPLHYTITNILIGAEVVIKEQKGDKLVERKMSGEKHKAKFIERVKERFNANMVQVKTFEQANQENPNKTDGNLWQVRLHIKDLEHQTAFVT